MTGTSFGALVKVLTTLESLQIPHMLVGSFSCNAYTYPRSTKDADIVYRYSDGDIGRIHERLGGDFKIDLQMSFETFTGSVRNVVTYKPTMFDIELFRLGTDAHHQQRFERKALVPVPGIDILAPIPTPEDVIIQKLRWARPKDVDDAANVIGAQLQSLDWTYIHRWTDEHETTELLEKLRAEVDE